MLLFTDKGQYYRSLEIQQDHKSCVIQSSRERRRLLLLCHVYLQNMIKYPKTEYVTLMPTIKKTKAICII